MTTPSIGIQTAIPAGLYLADTSAIARVHHDPVRAAGCADILTAAIAEQYGAIVLHYDTRFYHIAAVSGLQTRWVVPRGTVP